MDIDLKLKLMCGCSYYIDGIGNIPPLKLGDIAKVGYTTYAHHLKMINLTLQDLGLEQYESQGLEPFDVLVLSGNIDLENMFLDSIKFFLKAKEIFVSEEEGKIVINDEGFGDIDRISFKKLKSFVLSQNGIDPDKKVEKEEELDDKTREILEKLKKSKDKVNEIKKSDSSEDDMDISDIISAVSTKSNSINIVSIWDLTIYQLYLEYKRLEVVSQYDISIQSLMHGAKSEDLDIKHWSSKIRD